MKLKFTVPSEYDGRSLESFIRKNQDLSRRLISRMKREHRIHVNGVPQKINHILAQGDLVELYVDIDKPSQGGVAPENLQLEILYEDQTLIAINKAPGMVVHPVANHQHSTVANGVAYLLNKQGKPPVVRPVSRLDRDTTGIILFAKNSFIQEALIRQMKTGSFKKGYVAICHKPLTLDSGVIDSRIARKPGSIMHREVNPEGKESKTLYQVIRKNEKASYLKLWLETGRTHQIRVHLKHIGHPIIGDDLYNPGWESYGITRQALHSNFLSFIHPLTKKTLELNAPMPSDMIELLSTLFIDPYA